MKIVKLTKNKGEERNTTKKIYILSDGKQHMVKLKIENNKYILLLLL